MRIHPYMRWALNVITMSIVGYIILFERAFQHSRNSGQSFGAGVMHYRQALIIYTATVLLIGIVGLLKWTSSRKRSRHGP